MKMTPWHLSIHPSLLHFTHLLPVSLGYMTHEVFTFSPSLSKLTGPSVTLFQDNYDTGTNLKHFFIPFVESKSNPAIRGL